MSWKVFDQNGRLLVSTSDVGILGPVVLTTTDLEIPNGRVLTGNADITITDNGPGSTIIPSLSHTGVSPSFYGDSSHVAVITVDINGRVTAAFSTPILLSNYISTSLPDSQIIVGNAGNIAAAVSLGGDATIDNTGSITISKIGAKSISLANSFITSGNFSLTLTQTGTTNITLPTSGTVATQTYVNGQGFITTNQTITFSPSGDVTGSTTGTITLSPVLTIGAGRVTNAMLAGSIDLTTKVTGVLPIANGGTGTTSLNGVANFKHTIFTPATGNTVNLVNNQYNIINPAGALLAVTLNLPTTPANNDVVYIKYTQTITTVTYANGTVVDGITAPSAGGLVVLVYDSGSTSWY